MGDLIGGRLRGRAPLARAPGLRRATVGLRRATVGLRRATVGLRRATVGRALGGLLAASIFALGGCGVSAHRLDRSQEARLLSEIAGARRAAAVHDRAAARSALESFLETVAELRRRGVLTATQFNALEGQADGALHAAMVLLASRAAPSSAALSTTARSEQSASGATTQSVSATAGQPSAGSPAAKSQGSGPGGPPGRSGGAGQGPPQASGPHGGPGQGQMPPGQARKRQGDGNDNQGGDGQDG